MLYNTLTLGITGMEQSMEINVFSKVREKRITLGMEKKYWFFSLLISMQKTKKG